MHIYADYITPITAWLHQHPNYALLFTYGIALLESLAIIGTIVPGSLTMTAIGILAGSGVMRFDLTILFASLGAFTGDSFSYLLGSVYSERLSMIWPFTRYPKLLTYGKDFFARHGGKSVLIGRFTGPLRSITPIIAGMLHMSRLHFFAANFISAIGWAILYLLPGYIIGAASNQLSADSAQHLFGLVMGALVLGWLLSLLLKTLARIINRWFAAHMNSLWNWSNNNPYTRYLITKLRGPKDRNPQKIITLLFILMSCLSLTLLLTIFVTQDTWISHFNHPVSYFLQTLRSPTLDTLLIVVTFIFYPLSLSCLSLLLSLIALYSKDWRFLKYWLSLIAFTAFIVFACIKLLSLQAPTHLFSEPSPAHYPAINLCIGTALFSFLIQYLLKYKPNYLRYTTSYCMITLLLLAGFATIYLGDNWLSSVLGAYGIGFTIGLSHWILYRRKTLPRHPVPIVIGLSMGLVICTTSFLYHKSFATIVRQHTPHLKHYTLNQDTWWYQSEPILPRYSKNRAGRQKGVFNVQYAGSIQELSNRLELCGWKKQPKSFLYSLIIRAERRHTTETLPFMEQLYLNHHPTLTMSYRSKEDDNIYILRLWKSNYHLMHYQDPIWLGNIILAQKKNHGTYAFKPHDPEARIRLFVHVLPAVHDYQITSIPVNSQHQHSWPYRIPSEVLIIKN
ncbi:MAG: VTT domain-containing protein [Gammaproteobacteria bacterium]|nr:VTT domain-containing protein [Gammaproteobacteria bacterium]